MWLRFFLNLLYFLFYNRQRTFLSCTGTIKGHLKPKVICMPAISSLRVLIKKAADVVTAKNTAARAPYFFLGSSRHPVMFMYNLLGRTSTIPYTSATYVIFNHKTQSCFNVLFQFYHTEIIIYVMLSNEVISL